MVTTKLNLSMTEPQVRQIYAKQGDTGRVLDITLDQTPEDGTLRILRPDGTEVTSEAVTGGEVSESGETVTFDSLTEADVTELTVGIEPVQDLNGYDKPWVGGAGKNKLPLTLAILKANNTSGTWNGNVYTHNNGCVFTVGTNDGVTATTISVTGTASGGRCNFLFTNTTTHEELLGLSLNGCPSGGSVSTYFIGGYNLTDGTTPFLPDTGSGTTIPSTLSGKSFRIYIGILQGVNASGKVFYPMAYNSADGSAWTPYSNICPITGHDEVTVTRAGKNLLDPDAFASGRSQYYNVNSDGSINVVANDSTAWNNVPYIPLKAGTYTLSWVTQPSGQLRMKTSDDGYSAESYIGAGNKRYTFTLTDEGGIKLKIGINASYPYAEYLQLELGSTATSYEPYQSNTYTTSLGQTVYGGTLDMVSGVLNVTYGYKDIDDFTRLSSGASSGGLRVATIDGTYTEDAPSVCSMLEQKNHAQAWGSTTECYAIEGNGIRVYTTETALADFKTKFAQLQIAYPLVEPVTYQLTPQQIKTLVGTNNVWASSGDIVNITFTYGGLLSELPSEATEIVGKCYCDIEQNGVSSMPFTLNVKKNERQ